MNNNDQLFELITKMYGEMQEGFKQVNSRITGVESKVESIEGEVKEIKEELRGFREETTERFDNLEDKLIEMEGINAANHVFIKTKLNKVSEDLDFLTHKEFQTEREMFHIKQKLNKQKRNIK